MEKYLEINIAIIPGGITFRFYVLWRYIMCIFHNILLSLMMKERERESSSWLSDSVRYFFHVRCEIKKTKLSIKIDDGFSHDFMHVLL
jgi:hypothetical protein